MTNTTKQYCAFCAKDQAEVSCLVAGPSAYICDECIDLCAEIIAKRKFEAAVRVEVARRESTPSVVPIAGVGDAIVLPSGVGAREVDRIHRTITLAFDSAADLDEITRRLPPKQRFGKSGAQA